MKKFLGVLWRTLVSVILVAALVFTATGISPIYKFQSPKPFEGPDIFNPYSQLDTALGWKRSLFHCHTRVKGPLNECRFTAKETLETLEKLGYDVVTFSNHNEITPHPTDSALQVNVYEHGYSPFKFHKLVFGSRKVKHFDPLLPVLASQKQFELDYLGDGSDFIQMNHPYRTVGTSKSHMEKLTGYEIMELDTHISTENEYWDWALSAGHYSFGLANDDLHYPDWTAAVGIRCNFLNTPSGRYEDLKKTLMGGCYYSMRVPDYGNGDWEEKIEKNKHLPYIEDIGLDGDTIHISLSEQADSIRVNGQDHATLALYRNSASATYTMKADDHFARITAFFPGGEVIYTNPFARYDASLSSTPLEVTDHPVNIVLTILYNLAVLALFAALVYLLCCLWKRK